MMPETQKQDIPQFVTDGKKLAKAQVLADKLVAKLTSGNFWSLEDLKKILEESLCEMNSITH